MPVSTTIQSWPHSSSCPGIEAGALPCLHDYPVVAPFKLQCGGHWFLDFLRSPRLSSRGPIQAGQRVLRWRAAGVCLHDYPVVAPFKLQVFFAGPASRESPRLSSRGPIQARTGSAAGRPAQDGLHDYPVVAPFKHRHHLSHLLPDRLVSTTIQSWPHSSLPTHVHEWDLSESPRLSSRGPIQAWSARFPRRAGSTSPRLSSRGPIQARSQRSTQAIIHGSPRLSSRGPIQAPSRPRPRAPGSCVSTTIQSWPHSSAPCYAQGDWESTSPRLSSRGPIQAPCARSSRSRHRSSPRLSSRGPIQARPAGAQVPRHGLVSTTIQSWPHSSLLCELAVVLAFAVSTTIQSWPHSSSAHVGARCSSNGARLHDYPVVAPFKRSWRCRTPRSDSRSPRLSSRGPIQAPPSRHASGNGQTGLHDYPVVAPFKQGRHLRWHPGKAGLHDYPVVAPFL